MANILVTRAAFTLVLLAVSDLALFYALPRESLPPWAAKPALPSGEHQWSSHPHPQRAADHAPQTEPSPVRPSEGKAQQAPVQTAVTKDTMKDAPPAVRLPRGHEAQGTEAPREFFPGEWNGTTADTRTLVFAAHIGDAVVSVGGLLAREGLSSRAVTVFAGSPSDSSPPSQADLLAGYNFGNTETVAARISEDELAFKHLNGADASRWSMMIESAYRVRNTKTMVIEALTVRMRAEIDMSVAMIANAISAEEFEENTGLRVLGPRWEKDADTASLSEAFTSIARSYKSHKSVPVTFFEYESPLATYSDKMEAHNCRTKAVAIDLTDDQLRHKLSAVGEQKYRQALSTGLSDIVKLHAGTTCGVVYQKCEVLRKVICQK